MGGESACPTIMGNLRKVIAGLKGHYGEPKLPGAKGPFELVLWENACYLLSDERRAAVFEALRQRVGLNAAAIWKADKAVLLPLAAMGGMRRRRACSAGARLRGSHRISLRATWMAF
jgi:hypothetical protein